jgi:hypothetical protein
MLCRKSRNLEASTPKLLRCTFISEPVNMELEFRSVGMLCVNSYDNLPTVKHSKRLPPSLCRYYDYKMSSIERNPFWDTHRRVRNEESPRFSWDLKVYCRIHKRPPLNNVGLLVILYIVKPAYWFVLYNLCINPTVSLLSISVQFVKCIRQVGPYGTKVTYSVWDV